MNEAIVPSTVFIEFVFTWRVGSQAGRGIPSLPSDLPGMESRAHFSYASQVTHSQGSPLTIGVLPASGHPSPVFWSNPMNPCQNDPCLEWGLQFRATMATMAP